MPGGASGVQLKSKGPKTSAHDDNFGWRRYERSRLIVI